MSRMKIAVAQTAPVVGAFEQNAAQIFEAYERACAEQARFLLTSELSICGYPPHDLVERPEMFERNELTLRALAEFTRGKKTALIVGHIARNPLGTGRAAQNVASVLEQGREVFRQAKTLLPTYDVFDEARYFEPANEVDFQHRFWNCDGLKVAIAICEDLWGADPTWGRRLYGRDPVEGYRGAQLLLSLSASPFVRGKADHRAAVHSEVVRRLGIPLVYANQTGATDEILFDGGSFALDEKGNRVGTLPFFQSAYGSLDWESGSFHLGRGWTQGEVPQEGPAGKNHELETLHRGLLTGIREYFVRTGFKSAVLGLSGGIDSAVVATLAVQALGRENVRGVAMPSQYSSAHSLADAEALAQALGIAFEVRPIKFSFSTLSRELAEGRGALADIALENLQSRLRGLTLMTLSNHSGALVLTTGNKSELAVGYATLYGDMCGALAPIGDLYKTEVYELAAYINQSWSGGGQGPIPQSSITKPPSAELRPNQTDQDSLPPYELLDALLEDYLEAALPVAELVKKHGKKPGSPHGEWVQDTLRKVEVSEFKRRQAAPVLKVSPKAFGVGRRIPLAKRWDK